MRFLAFWDWSSFRACRPFPVCVLAARPRAARTACASEVARPDRLWLFHVNLLRQGCDEPFAVRDICLDNPDIGILALSASQILRKFYFVFNILLPRQSEWTCPVPLGHSFVKAGRLAAKYRYDQYRACVPFTFFDNRAESSLGLCQAQNRSGFQMRGKAAVRHVSRRWNDSRAGSRGRYASA